MPALEQAVAAVEAAQNFEPLAALIAEWQRELTEPAASAPTAGAGPAKTPKGEAENSGTVSRMLSDFKARLECGEGTLPGLLLDSAENSRIVGELGRHMERREGSLPPSANGLRSWSPT